MSNPETKIGDRAQAAFVAWTNGHKVSPDVLTELEAADNGFTVSQDGINGVFTWGEHTFEYGSGVHVILRARTGDSECQEIRLRTDLAGRPLFKINHIAELIEDPA